MRIPTSAALLLLTFTSGAAPLHIDVFVSDDSSYYVTSTIVYGDTEAILVDAQFHNSQAVKLADRIAKTGRRLTAIFITHPDGDHYIGLGVLHERFPNARILMTAGALEEFAKSSAGDLEYFRRKQPDETPQSLPSPEVLTSTALRVDGESVLVIKDCQGDVLKPLNSFLWIPSLRAVVAGDVVFEGI